MFTINKLKPQNRHDFSFGKQKGHLSPAVRVNVGLGEEEGAAARPIAPDLSQPLSAPVQGPPAPGGSHPSEGCSGLSGCSGQVVLFPTWHRSVQVIYAFPFKPGFYLYLARQSLLLGPVSKSLEAFPLMLTGSSPEQMSFSLGSGAAAPNLGQTSGLLSSCVHGPNAALFPHHAGTAPVRTPASPAAWLAKAALERFPPGSPGYRAGGFKVLPDEKTGPFRDAMRWSLAGEGTRLGLGAGFREGRCHLVTCVGRTGALDAAVGHVGAAQFGLLGEGQSPVLCPHRGRDVMILVWGGREMSPGLMRGVAGDRPCVTASHSQ